MRQEIRLAKRIAESGVASRRGAERMIEDGRVTVDGQVIKTPVFFVTDCSEISVDGKNIPQKSEEEPIIWKFHKPAGVVTTAKDPQNRKTVFDFFPDAEGRLLYVGRLDYNSEGLLLFTNSGPIARKLELPDTGLRRTYRARIFGNPNEEKIRLLEKGATVDRVKYRPIEIEKFTRSGGANFWITITLSEGKNREIRKMAEYLGCTVNRLIRTDYGPFGLGTLKPGQILRASAREINGLPDSIKSFFRRPGSKA